MKVEGIDHVQLAMPAGAEGKARAFYEDILGLGEISKPAEITSRGGVWFKCGRLQLHLGIDSDFRPAKKAHPALTVKGYAELLKTLAEAGYEVLGDTSIPAITRCFTFDPFGNRIELISTDRAWTIAEQKEEYVHFEACIDWINNAWLILQTIQKQSGNPLIGPAFRFALVEYCKAYKNSHGIISKKHILDTALIPKERRPLHERIVASRDQIQAHSDITVMDANLHVHDFMGQRYTSISQNVIHGMEELPNLQEIIALIEATLNNMYAHKEVLKNALPTPH